MALARVMTHLTGPVAIILAALGLAMLWLRRERRDLAMLTSTAFIIFLLPLANSGHLPPHYTLPFLPILGLWAGIGAATTTGWVARRQAGAARPLGITLAALVILVNGLDTLGWLRAMQQPVTKVEVAKWLQQHTRAAERLALPTTLAPYVPPSERALANILKSYREQPTSATHRLTHLLDSVGNQSRGMREPSFLLDAWLVDDEAIDIFRYRAMRHAARSGAAPPTARDAVYFQPGRQAPSKPDRIHHDQAVEALRRGDVDLLVVDEPLSATEAARLEPQEPGFGWSVYRRPSSRSDHSIPLVDTRLETKETSQ